jgi:pimeloyl-ACP methyl ester carboxylesterase
VDDYVGGVLDGVGHFIPEQAPDLLRDRVLEFLAAPVAPRSAG